MTILLVGINHTTANIALREKVAFPPETIGAALREVQVMAGFDEPQKVMDILLKN